MKLTFFGATGTVTGSKYLIETESKKILLDCGLFQGLKDLRLRNWEGLPLDYPSLDAVILTHAHLDHSGYLPAIVQEGFRGPIYSTPGTRDLAEILLPDSAKIQEEDAEHANRHNYSKHHPALPLYTQRDAQQALSQFQAIDYHTRRSLDTSMSFEFFRAGHIVGASFVTLKADNKTILFTGDLGRPSDIIMKAPELPQPADYLVVESTYGDRLHQSESPLDQLESIIKETVARRGVILVPAFSVGRTQQLLFCLNHLRKTGRIPEFPVYLNSPMSIKATSIFCKHTEDHHLSPTECEEICANVTYTQTVEESKALNQRSGPMLIISASGMATGGRVVHHLKAFGGDSKNTILLCGFQAAGTRGADLVKGVRSLKIHGQAFPIKAEVKQLLNLSAHADQREILNWLKNFSQPPRMTFITHGEPEASAGLSQSIQKELHWNCRVPHYLEEVTL